MTKFGKIIAWVILIILVLGGIYFYFQSGKTVLVAATSFEECAVQGNPIMESYPEQCIDKLGNHFTHNIVVDKSDKIKVTFPAPNATVTSPLIVKGEARGGWFFEASFPVVVTDWDGKIIGEGPAQAQGDWMTPDFVPFTATITFTTATTSYSSKGTLILKKDNPSGLPENDDAIEIPINLK